MKYYDNNMTKPERLDFDQLPDPFNKQDRPETTNERVLEIAKNPALLSEMDLVAKLRFTTEAFRLLVESEDLRNQFIEILKERTNANKE